MKAATNLKTGFFILLLAASITSCKKAEKESTDASEGQTQTYPATESNNANDVLFLSTAAMISIENIELGKLAQTRATSKEVKELATMMVDGHTKSLNELKALATQKGATLPEEVSEEGKKASEELTSVTMKDFEKLYLSKMVDGHKDAITKFETTRDNTADADIKEWIIKTLPDLQMHLDHAIETQQKLKL